MYKQTSFTSTTPLPSHLPKDAVVATLHNHREIIEMNPLVIHYERCDAPAQAPADEHQCSWYEITDRISCLPWGFMQGRVSYKGGFCDRPGGIQTHVYAPMGLEIRSTWTVCGSMQGDTQEPTESGLGDAPREGLYLREDVDMQCLIFASWFIRRTLEQSHSALVDRLIMRADKPSAGRSTSPA